MHVLHAIVPLPYLLEHSFLACHSNMSSSSDDEGFLGPMHHASSDDEGFLGPLDDHGHVAQIVQHGVDEGRLGPLDDHIVQHGADEGFGGPLDDHGHVVQHVAEPEEEEHGFLDIAVVVHEEPVAQEPPTNALKLCLKGVKGQNRSQVQHTLNAANMRYAKLKKAVERERAAEKDRVVALANSLQHAALRTSAKVLVRSNRSQHTTLCICSPGASAGAGRLSSYSWMKLAFDDPHVADRALSRRYAMDPKTVREAIVLMGYMVLKTSACLLNMLGYLVTEGVPRIGIGMPFAMWTLCWDETSRLLILPLAPFAVQQRRSLWHVLVSTSELEVVWSRSCLTGKTYLHRTFSIPRANCALISTDAGCIHEGLFNYPAAKSHADGVKRVLSAASLSSIHFGLDAAAPNIRLLNFKMPELSAALPRTLVSYLTCCLHGNDLIKGHIMKDFIEDVSKLYAVNSLCKQGSNFLRVLHFVPKAIDSLLVCEKGTPPHDEVQDEFKSEFLSYIDLHDSQQKKSHAHGKTKRQQHRNRVSAMARQAYLDAWQTVFLILNCSWFTHPWWHVCSGPQCCNNYDRRVTVAKLTRALLLTVFLAMPTSPELGKWTKLGPALDNVYHGKAVGGIQGVAVKMAFEGGNTQLPSWMAANDVDGAYMEECHWQALRGKRAKASVSVLTEGTSMTRITVLTIAVEPIRALMRVFFAFAGVEKDNCDSSGQSDSSVAPGLVVFTSCSSPIHMMLRYVSSFLSMRGSKRVLLVMQICQCKSFSEFWTVHKSTALLLRRTFMAVGSWIFLRRSNVTTWRCSLICFAFGHLSGMP